MTSQLVITRAFLFIIFVPPTLGLKKNSRKSTNEKILALLFVRQKWVLSQGKELSSCEIQGILV